MLRAIPAGRGSGTGGSTRRSILELLIGIRGGMRIALAVGLLACFGSQAQGLWASTPPVPPGLTVHRSTRMFPNRFTVRPNGATIAANQTQRFEVTDASGESVAVRWNVSGLDCSGSACGTIDDQGVYRTPSSLPQPRVVILEGVLVSDPNYSVLTQIELVAAVATTGSPASAQVFTSRTQQTPGLAVGKQNLARNAVLPPPPNAVAAAPVVERQTIARASQPPPPSKVTAPTAMIEVGNVAPRYSLPPPPNAVAAAPVAERQTIARASPAPPLSNVTGPTAAIEGKNIASRQIFSPLPNAIAAAPVVETQIVARNSPLLPLPIANAAGPVSGQVSASQTQRLTASVAGQSVARHAALLPVPDEAAAPVAETPVTTPSAPMVTYRDGQLTIDAQNSTLAEVLKLVAEKSGATIDIPPGSGLERIFEHSGPGPAQDVLARLLNGSAYDFIIVSSPQSPHAPAQVLLSLHRADGAASVPPEVATTAASPLWTPPQTPAIEIMRPQYDSSLTAPTEALSPEARGELMKEKAREIREKIAQQYPPQQ